MTALVQSMFKRISMAYKRILVFEFLYFCWILCVLVHREDIVSVEKIKQWVVSNTRATKFTWILVQNILLCRDRDPDYEGTNAYLEVAHQCFVEKSFFRNRLFGTCLLLRNKNWSKSRKIFFEIYLQNFSQFANLKCIFLLMSQNSQSIFKGSWWD